MKAIVLEHAKYTNAGEYYLRFMMEAGNGGEAGRDNSRSQRTRVRIRSMMTIQAGVISIGRAFCA
jgi:hypothetical protein